MPLPRCTLIGCESPFGVTFSRLGGWPDGTYRVEVTTDGERIACEVDIPRECELRPRCTGDGPWFVNESGCARDPDARAIRGVSFFRYEPSSVEVAVYRGSRRLGGDRYAPTYATTRPNGPECEPTCRVAPAGVLALQP